MARDNPFVLIVEDDAASAEALGMILRDWGAEVAHAVSADGVATVDPERLRGLRYLITDFHIGPGPDGIALAAQIAAQAPNVRILVLSGSFHGRAAVAAAAAGYEIMQKPARAEAIVAWLDRP